MFENSQIEFNKNTIVNDISLKINWVYGFRCRDVKKPI